MYVNIRMYICISYAIGKQMTHKCNRYSSLMDHVVCLSNT